MLTREEVKELVVERVDPDIFIERMGLTIEQLVEAFEEELDVNRELFDDELFDGACGGDDLEEAETE